jgi:hypothetical protein
MGGAGTTTTQALTCDFCGDTTDVRVWPLPTGPVVDGDEYSVPMPACSSCLDLYLQDRQLERAELAEAAADEQRFSERWEG